MKVLVVDDDRTVRQKLKEYLEALGHEVALASNGRVAVDVLYGKEETPDPAVQAIISDMEMPKYSGLWLLQYLSQRRADLHCLLLGEQDECVDRDRSVRLSQLPRVFPFVRVHLKTDSPKCIEEFLETVQQ